MWQTVTVIPGCAQGQGLQTCRDVVAQASSLASRPSKNPPVRSSRQQSLPLRICPNPTDTHFRIHLACILRMSSSSDSNSPLSVPTHLCFWQLRRLGSYRLTVSVPDLGSFPTREAEVWLSQTLLGSDFGPFTFAALLLSLWCQDLEWPLCYPFYSAWVRPLQFQPN